MQVIKRDGRVMEFNKERIVDAITKAMSQTPGGIDIELANKIATSVEKQLEDKTKEVQDLEAENISISKKAHTLDHKQKSLAKKIDEMMMNTEISKEETAEVRDRLNKIGKDLYKEQTTTELAKTELPEIDDMLKYMQSECSANKIDFELQLKGNIHYMINNLISKEDLETLLADHIKNAIIAINHTDNINRSILVRLGEIDGIYSLYIYDTGIEFEKETLENVEVGKVALESTTGIQSEDGEALRETDGNGWEAGKSPENLDDKTEIAVHICGAVHQPGVYVFQGKYRIYDGIQKAGGFTKEAEENYLNLALYLEDGMKIEVPTKEEVKSWREKDGITAAGISYKDDDGVALGKSKNDGRVNLNTADVTLLCTLSGIGKSRAESIIA